MSNNHQNDAARNRQRKGWIVLFAMLFCGIIVIMNQFKVPTFMGALMHDFGTDPGTTGWLMSVIAVAGIITAFPSAFLLNRFGPKRVGLAGLAFMVAGCAVGALSYSFAQLIVRTRARGHRRCHDGRGGHHRHLHVLPPREGGAAHGHLEPVVRRGFHARLQHRRAGVARAHGQTRRTGTPGGGSPMCSRLCRSWCSRCS
ncbi:MAG: MFS transporter [Gordonibacter pamelaeae]